MRQPGLLLLLTICTCATALAQSVRIGPDQQANDPPLLNVNVPSPMSRLTSEEPKLTQKQEIVVSVKSTVTEVGEDSQENISSSPNFQEVSQTESASANQTLKIISTIPPDVVTLSSVKSSISEVSSSDTSVRDDDVVTKTSLQVSQVEELSEQGDKQPETGAANRTAQNVSIDTNSVVNSTRSLGTPGVENIQEILKQIQNEVGEARILYVADPKAKKGVRIAHTTTEAATEDDYDDDYNEELLPITTPQTIVKLKKIDVTRERPSIIRKRPNRPTTSDNSQNNLIALKQKPKLTRPAFGILQRPKKTTVAPGPRTVRPFVKVFDRAKQRPRGKPIQQVRIRKPGKRITTAKPIRKGFPIGPPRNATGVAPLPSGPSLQDFEEIYRRQKAQNRNYETSTYRTVEEDVPDDFGEPDFQEPLAYYEGQTRITDGWEWSPYLDDRNTKEFKYLAFHVKQQLKSFLDETRYGEFLNYILIDGFRKGVDVDFFLVFYKTEPMIDDGSLTEEIREVMAYKALENEYEFLLDPNATFFKFKYVKTPATERLVEAALLPNWAIAMLVFGFGSLVLIGGSVIMANNFRSMRRLKNIKKKKNQDSTLQMPMKDIKKTPQRYADSGEVKKETKSSKSKKSEPSLKSFVGSSGTLDRRPPMLERFQKDYKTYEQKNPQMDEIYDEYEERRRRNEARYPAHSKSRRSDEAIHQLDGYSTVGSHFPSSYKSLLKPSKSILYRPDR